MTNKEELIQKLSDYVLEMEDEAIVDLANAYIKEGYSAEEGILSGLVDGMNRAGELYESEEYFIPELLVCSDAMYNGLDVMRPHLDKSSDGQQCKIAIGVVEGDTHDIGKNLVKIMLEAAGYDMLDLGRDVPIEKFVEAVKNDDAQVVALSTLMSTSMINMKKIIDALTEAGLRDKAKVIVGGAPLTPSYADKIGADGYSTNAVDAVKLVDSFFEG